MKDKIRLISKSKVREREIFVFKNALKRLIQAFEQVTVHGFSPAPKSRIRLC